MTNAEQILWKELRGRQCAGLKFRRQAPIAQFVVDFLCMERSFIIEIDGDVHREQKEYDTWREQELQRRGYRILRFRNEAVLQELPYVIQQISVFSPSPSKKNVGAEGEGQG